MILTTTTAVDTELLPLLSRVAGQRPIFERIYGRLPVELLSGVDALQNDNEKPRRLPLYTSPDTNKSGPVLPDIKAGGLLFFVATGAARTPDWFGASVSYGGTYTTELPMALLAWWPRNAVNSPDAVKKDLLTALGNLHSWVTTSVDDQIATGVFRGLDYDYDNHNYLVYPYAGLRIEGTLSITESICS